MKIFYVFVSNLMVIVPSKMINWSIKLNLSYVIKLKWLTNQLSEIYDKIGIVPCLQWIKVS